MMIINKTLEPPVAAGTVPSSTDLLAEMVAGKHLERGLVMDWS